MTAVIATFLVLGITAGLFFYLLALRKIVDPSPANGQFRWRFFLFGRRLLLTLFALFTVVRLADSILERQGKVELIRKVDPIYPALAKEARAQGKVRFDAVINSSGQVERLKLISGHPLLIPAAKNAIFQWQYTRPLSNVHTTIE